MCNVHRQVTVALVEEYIKPDEMVILCVIPAMSDFGNAEVRDSGVSCQLGISQDRGVPLLYPK